MFYEMHVLSVAAFLLVCGGIGLVALLAYRYSGWPKMRRSDDGRKSDNCNCPLEVDVMLPQATQTVGQTTAALSANSRRRLRELGIKIGYMPTGAHNAITDVPGVKVGHTTVVSDKARTGVTVVLPHSCNLWDERVSAGCFVLNGNGTMTGLDWVRESGFLEGPLALTCTHSVGDVYKALIKWMIARYPQIGTTDETYLPVVGECDDSSLNDAHGFHVQEAHVLSALAAASSGAVAEGAVGAGTGMSCYDFKGGIGTASRLVEVGDKTYTIGVLLNCNHGDRDQLRVDGVPVGSVLETEMATMHREGSICIIVGTDAPLCGRQLERIAKRAAMGLARTGATANSSSGDIILAFSNGRTIKRSDESEVFALPEVNDNHIDELYKATVEATEEAVINALCMAQTTVGRDGNVAPQLPLDRMVEILKQHGKLP